jgi:DNA-binding CsgD family transcriptional regulator
MQVGILFYLPILHPVSMQKKYCNMKEFKTVEFTAQEIKVIRLLSKQFESDEVARIMNLSRATVENYRRRIQKKIGAKNVVGIVLYAYYSEIIKVERYP